MKNFYLDSDTGRIGPLWWANSDLRPQDIERFFYIRRLAVRWGTFGFGRELKLNYEVIDTLNTNYHSALIIPDS